MSRILESDKALKWLMVTPALAILLIFVIFPLLWSLGLSFYSYSVMYTPPGVPPTFVGLQNFQKIFQDVNIYESFQRTAYFVALAVGLEFFGGFAIAELLNTRFRGRRIVVTLILIPMMTAPAVIGIFFEYMYNPTYGVVPYFISLVGIKDFNWMTREWVIPAVASMDAWMWTPFMMLIILAGLQAVPRYLYEAAEIDRASLWMRFRYITLPTISPILAIALLFRTMDALKLFDLIFPVTAGGPGAATQFLSVRLYLEVFEYFKTGYGSAFSYIFLVIIIVLSNIYVRVLTRRPQMMAPVEEAVQEV